jgi:hypothetical protein
VHEHRIGFVNRAVTATYRTRALLEKCQGRPVERHSVEGTALRNKDVDLEHGREMDQVERPAARLNVRLQAGRDLLR